MSDDPDDTIRVPVARATPDRATSDRVIAAEPAVTAPAPKHLPIGSGAAPWLPILVMAIFAAGIAGGGAWLWWPRTESAAVAPAIQTEAAPQPAPQLATKPGGPITRRSTEAEVAQPVSTTLAFQDQRSPASTATALPRLATEAEILADSPAELAIYRFAPAPSVLVLQFPSLAQQADMLNRIAGLIEKSGYPHDKVLSRADLDARIRSAGGSPDTFYYGHDYSAAEIIRFFGLAPNLNESEQRLRKLASGLSWDTAGAVGAMISLVGANPAQGLDEAARAAILRHELSHGIFFTDPIYGAYCRTFWQDTLSSAERERFGAFLAREGYDTALPDLVVNEMQAYLMHTPDRRFFTASEVGLSPTRIVELRQVFLVGMPPGWLRDHTSADLPP